VQGISLSRFILVLGVGLVGLTAAGLAAAPRPAMAQSQPDDADEYIRHKDTETAPVKAPRYELNSVDFDNIDPPPPPTLEQLENIEPVTVIKEDKLNPDAKSGGLPINLRDDAMKEAALSYGARGGLAWRTYQIRQDMKARQAYMDKVFDFRVLLIPAPSGLLIEPPVISEQDNATLVQAGGSAAAVADRVYEINKNARIVNAPRDWRNYLEREWGTVTDPPDLLRPQNPKERAKWKDWVRTGWKEGIKQADEIFEEDLNQLTGDYRGMVRYRMLLAQGMVSPPYAMQTDRGVTGDGTTMRVGDRQIEITGMPSLNTKSRTWKPANR
jgi:defect-in-organelle-trafficking protein DotC